jgi:hypothetical protein
MTWLKKFGTVVLKIIGVASGLLTGGGAQAIEGEFPQTTGVINTVESELTAVATVITDVEIAFGGAAAVAPTVAGAALPAQSGALKLAAATPLVQQIVAKSAFMKGQKVKNTELYQSAVKGLTSSMADLLNSLDPSTIQETKV